jgi:predicted nucleotidyltransferase
LNTAGHVETWHASTLNRLTHLLAGDPDVAAVAVYGSALRPFDLDEWSDVDVLIIIRDGEMERFFPTTDWLQPLGEIFAKEQFAGAYTSTTRVGFEDLRKLDLVFTTESDLEMVDRWPHVSFAGGLRVLFSRSTEISDRLQGEFPSPPFAPPTDEVFTEMVDGFWFRAMVAVSKTARDDLVIALHLALGLLQDGCVLAMMLRDREEGTNVHRTGGMANEIVASFEDTAQPPTAEGILNLIRASGVIFDRLAARWSASYEPRMSWLEESIARAKSSVSSRYTSEESGDG